MDYTKLDKLTYAELRDMAIQMDLRVRRSKVGLIEEISEAFREYEEYKHEKIDKYKKEQIATKSKNSTIYLVSTTNGTKHVMKVFRKHKSSTSLLKEIELQMLAIAERASPTILETDTVFKYVVMDRMERNLGDILKEQNGTLSRTQQKQIIHLYKKLDSAKVFHGDSSISNYMYIGTKLRIIDFSNAKHINKLLIKKLGTKTPNLHLMTFDLVSRLKKMNLHRTSYEYLCKYLTEEQLAQL